jgi:hypothetical protein
MVEMMMDNEVAANPTMTESLSDDDREPGTMDNAAEHIPAHVIRSQEMLTRGVFQPVNRVHLVISIRSQEIGKYTG